jgi:hypothetical protein
LEVIALMVGRKVVVLGQGPVEKIKLSGGLGIDIWEQNGKYGVEYTISYQKCYKAQDGTLKNTTSLRPGEVGLVIAGLLKAVLRCAELQQKAKRQEQSSDEQHSGGSDTPF